MIALLLVNVVWELHSTIRVKSLWIFFSQVSNFIMQSTTDFQYLKPDELIIELANSVYPYIGIWEYISGDPSVLSMDEDEK